MPAAATAGAAAAAAAAHDGAGAPVAGGVRTLVSGVMAATQAWAAHTLHECRPARTSAGSTSCSRRPLMSRRTALGCTSALMSEVSMYLPTPTSSTSEHLAQQPQGHVCVCVCGVHVLCLPLTTQCVCSCVPLQVAATRPQSSATPGPSSHPLSDSRSVKSQRPSLRCIT